MEIIDRVKRAKLESEQKRIALELAEIKKQEDALEKIKADKKTKREQFEHRYLMECKLFGANLDAQTRLIMYIANFCATQNPESLSVDMQKKYRVYELLQKLSEFAEKPLKAPKFDSDNNLIE